MPFSRKGFFGEEANIISEAIVKTNKERIELCLAIICHIERQLSRCDVSKTDFKEVVAAALFVRLIEGMQAAIFLVRKGFDLDSSVVIRGCLEAYAQLVLCEQDDNFSADYLCHYDSISLRNLEYLQEKYSDGSFGNIEKQIKSIKDRLSVDVKQKKELKNRFLVKNLFEAANLMPEYKGIYAMLSDNAHSNAGMLYSMLKFSKDESVGMEQINHGPSDVNAKLHLRMVAHYCLNAYIIFCRIFKIKDKKAINRYKRRIKEM